LEQYIHKVIDQGDASGNGMKVWFRLPSGLDIFGFPTANYYGSGWALGPTWNFLVMADEPFLVDTGRFGQGEKLAAMMASVGVTLDSLGFVLISHGHEDHDGGLAELSQTADLRVRAHAVYDLIIRRYPEKAPTGHKKDFPAKCWRCPMPESHSTRYCLDYHHILQDLVVEPIGDGIQTLAPGISTYHLPGHSPDSLAVRIGDEAMLVGDTLLPGITPWPTSEFHYDKLRGVIGNAYSYGPALFGLRRYIRSLAKLRKIAGEHPEMAVFPAHRLYHRARWNGFVFGRRIEELLRHHRDRCRRILEILDSGAKTANEISGEYFPEHLLKGYGSLMANNEIISHCELMAHCGDVRTTDAHTYRVTGSSHFDRMIRTGFAAPLNG
jgi:glyoxylase-like metal-dependent hydrolase (beta-lactamase superfamily II)